MTGGSPNAEASRPEWYHRVLLVLCAVALIALGMSMVLGGSDASSRFRSIDDPLVRSLGAALLVAAPALVFRWRWAFTVAVCVLMLSILETAVTFDPVASKLSVADMLVWVALVLAAPIPLLWWLRAKVAPR
ncbi:MAG: hypothetical protein Q7W30_00940 [Coriobacteriia bacterium]|nr:hypothetical protein [Coriobacteriia bacterium]